MDVVLRPGCGEAIRTVAFSCGENCASSSSFGTLNSKVAFSFDIIDNAYIFCFPVFYLIGPCLGGSPDGIRCYGQGERPPSGDSNNVYVPL